jgi:hypothetical protein
MNLSRYSLSFKNYYLCFTKDKDNDKDKESNLSNHVEWGWFVDTDVNSEPIPIPINKTRNYFNLPIPQTIYEYNNLSINSMKSMKNLHDNSMIFQIEDNEDKYQDENNKYNKENYCKWFV